MAMSLQERFSKINDFGRRLTRAVVKPMDNRGAACHAKVIS